MKHFEKLYANDNEYRNSVDGQVAKIQSTYKMLAEYAVSAGVEFANHSEYVFELSENCKIVLAEQANLPDRFRNENAIHDADVTIHACEIIASS